MILKAIALKIASWFAAEAKTVEADTSKALDSVAQSLTATKLGSEIASLVDTRYTLKTETTSDGKTYIAGIGVAIAGEGCTLEKSGEFEVTNSTTEVTMGNINTAIQIAVALKTIDASLTAEQVQAATNAALAALYPAPAPAAAA